MKQGGHGCVADAALHAYQDFLGLPDRGIPSIYTRADALKKMRKLAPSENARRKAAIGWFLLMRGMGEELIPAGQNERFLVEQSALD